MAIFRIPSDLASASELGLPGGIYIELGSGLPCFSCATTLTAKDKEVVKQATAWDIVADPDGKTASEAAFAFAGRLNMERYSVASQGDLGGGLTGRITSDYVEELI